MAPPMPRVPPVTNTTRPCMRGRWGALGDVRVSGGSAVTGALVVVLLSVLMIALLGSPRLSVPATCAARRFHLHGAPSVGAVRAYAPTRGGASAPARWAVPIAEAEARPTLRRRSSHARDRLRRLSL